jgi:hypothetical protein
MKRVILLLMLFVLTSQSKSQIFSEDFPYGVGVPLTSTGNWFASSGAGVNPLATTPGLSYPGYVGSGIGDAVRFSNTGEDDSSSIVSRPNSGTVYASFMVWMSSAQATGDYFFAMSTSGNAFDGRVYARSSGAGYQFGVTKANEATVNYTTGVYNFFEPYLVIVKYQFNAGANDDQVSLFVFDTLSPPPMVEPAPTIGPFTATSADAINLSRVILRQGNAANAPAGVIDGIYLDVSWNNNVLPVELSSFVSVINGNNVTLNWSTSTETNNSGFDIERSAVNGSWSKIGTVSGNGTSTTPHSYSFTNRAVATGKYNYRLKQTDFNGNFTYHNLGNEVNIGVPEKYDLSQNYPNPFNPSTKINYDLPTDGKVSIKLFDMSGKEVASLVNEVKTAGYHTVNFNASNLSSGVYFYRISVEANGNNFTATKKMMLVK